MCPDHGECEHAGLWQPRAQRPRKISGRRYLWVAIVVCRVRKVLAKTLVREKTLWCRKRKRTWRWRNGVCYRPPTSERIPQGANNWLVVRSAERWVVDVVLGRMQALLADEVHRESRWTIKEDCAAHRLPVQYKKQMHRSRAASTEEVYEKPHQLFHLKQLGSGVCHANKNKRTIDIAIRWWWRRSQGA